MTNYTLHMSGGRIDSLRTVEVDADSLAEAIRIAETDPANSGLYVFSGTVTAHP
jgi:hypothetical protein